MCALVELLRKVTVYRVLQKVCLVIDGNSGGGPVVELLGKVTVTGCFRALQKVCLVIDGNGGGVGEANAFVRGRQVLKNKNLRRQRHIVHVLLKISVELTFENLCLSECGV